MPIAALLLGAACGLQGPEWKVLVPESLESLSGATLEPQPDGSVRILGPGVEWDVHTFDLVTDVEVTAIKLEILADETLPAGGPGRGEKGDVHLSEVRLEAAGKRKRLAPVTLARAACEEPEGGLPASAAIDNARGSAWGLRSEVGRDAALLLAPAAAIAADEDGTRLRLTLEYGLNGGWKRGDAGRLRISVTSSPDPLAGFVDPLAGAGWNDLQRRINAAIDAGVNALWTQQELDGSWREHQPRFPVGQTALSVYTLLKSGVPHSHPGLRRAVEFLRSHPAPKTYGRGCQVMALCALDEEQDEELIERLVDDLISSQNRGVWAYPDSVIDLSNTQYAALGLRAAALAGFDVPKRAWSKLADGTLRFQEEAARSGDPAGFNYRGNEHVKGSMTTAGVAILTICEEQTRRAPKEWKAGREAGLAWLDLHGSVTSNPQPSLPPEQRRRSESGKVFYYLYGLERVGALLHRDRFGGHDWYREGARYLVDKQGGEGLWENSQSNTCFALLFLNRATHPVSGRSARAASRSFGRDDPNAALSLRASSSSEVRVWVSSWGQGTLIDFAHDGDEEKGPRVARVDYFLVPVGNAKGEPRLLASVPGDASRPAGLQRFATRHVFPRAGTYGIQAKAVVITPIDLVERILESPVLEVRVAQVHRPEFSQYALDATLNLLAGARPTVTASSQVNDSWAPKNAVDNLQGTPWRSADDDPLPRLRVELGETLRANTILLTHAADFRNPDVRHAARIHEVELIVNDKKSFLIEMEPEDVKKTVFQLPKPEKIDAFELVVRTVHDNDSELLGVGFNDVELQMRK